MRTLITGGFGYLGGRFAQFRAAASADELRLGSRRRAEAPAWLPDAMPVQTQWDCPTSLEEACAGMDAVVHAAGMNASDCASDPVGALEVNAVAVARMLRAAVKQGVKRFLYVSTAHVYASPLAGLITEETPPASLHPYATSHRAGEDVVRAAHQRGDIEGIVVRLSNAYGAPADSGANCWMLLINDLCRQAATTRAMTLRSAGLQRRNFIPITDACRAIDALLNAPQENVPAVVINVGGDWSPTVWEAASLVQERSLAVLGYRPALGRAPAQASEIANELDFRFDILRSMGFQPDSNHVDELDRLLEFCASSFR
jgi:UDP-glucose 4-epimerase